MAQGTCKWFSNQKGYGFITPSDGSKEIFVHQSNILSDGFRTLAEGQLVKYEIDNSNPKGSRAVDVQAIGVIDRSTVPPRKEAHGHRPHA